MKKILLILTLTGCLLSCGIFRSRNPDLHDPADSFNDDPHTACPPSAFGAEKINSYLDKKDKEAASKHATEKGDPITGKKTSVAKGIRTGELDKPVKLTRAERREKRKTDRRKKAEERALEKQIEKDKALEKKEQNPY